VALWFNGYQIGFELLLINALLTFIGLWIISEPAAYTLSSEQNVQVSDTTKA
jgi:hypothetical protein